MERYFFDLHGDPSMLDQKGTVLRDDKQLALYMISIANAWVVSDKRGDWQLHALNEGGERVATLQFSAPAKPAHRPGSRSFRIPLP